MSEQSWWQPPALRIDPEQESRRATWLELFYDLVFVVAVTELGAYLEHDLTLRGGAEFVFLFTLVWWVWISTVFFASRFDTDDLLQRLLTGLQILAIVAVAVNISDALGETAGGFALAYALSRLVLVAQYARAWQSVPAARPLTRRFVAGFALTTVIWAASAAVPDFRVQMVIWVVALVIDFLTPLGSRKIQTDLPPHAEHLPERLGLFTIIVLGHAVVSASTGIASEEATESGFDTSAMIVGSLALLAAFGLWWIYFDNLDSTAIVAVDTSGRVWLYQAWLYAHLPLAIGVTAAGTAVELAIIDEDFRTIPDPVRVTLVLGFAACLFSLSVIEVTRVAGGAIRRRFQPAFPAASGCIVLALVWIDSFRSITVMAILAAVSSIQIAIDVMAGTHPVEREELLDDEPEPDEVGIESTTTE